MTARILSRIAIFGLITLLLVNVLWAVAASNSVPGSRLGSVGTPITDKANLFKPPECNFNITVIFVCPAGGGNCNAPAGGGNPPKLILGSPYADVITSGGNGRDCILGGGGDDSINGGGGNDICFGGPGTDTFTNCETVFQDGP